MEIDKAVVAARWEIKPTASTNCGIPYGSTGPIGKVFFSNVVGNEAEFRQLILTCLDCAGSRDTNTLTDIGIIVDELHNLQVE